jgi:hypothetical protein
MTTALLISFFIILLFILQKIEKNRNKDRNEIKELKEELDRVKNELNELKNDVEGLSLSEYEKEHRAFDNVPNLNIFFFEKLEKGQILNLMSGSYYYPSEEIVISKFQYKHDHIDRENKTDHGWEVHGFKRFSDSDEWTPCTFLANENECMTSSCSGTIKRSYFDK